MAVTSQGINLVRSMASFINCLFTNWHSVDGRAVYADKSNVTFSDISVFSYNIASNSGGVLRAKYSTVNFSGTSTFLENEAGVAGAGLYSFESQILFNGSCTFKLNQAGTGGGVYVERSTLRILNRTLFSEDFGDRGAINGEINFINNIAHNGSGGALYAPRSTMDCEGNINFINNSAENGAGGGIYIVDSTLQSSGNITFAKNHAGQEGGVYAIDSITNITGSCSFQENTATDGGGMALEESDLGKGTKLVLHSPVTINLEGNRAISKGGGLLFISSNAQCKVEYESCFFRIEGNSFLNAQLNLTQNSAGQAGTVLYGGFFMEYCYIKMNNIVRLSTYNRYFDKLNISYSKDKTISSFSSDPVKVCFCNDNYTRHPRQH